MTARAARARPSIPITRPDNTALIGGQAFHQGWVMDPPADQLDLAVSNGGASMTGS